MENFSKTKSIIIYCIFALIFAVGTIFTFVPMQFGSKDYLSSFGAIRKSSEIGDSISAVYKITESESTNIDKAISMIGERIEEKFGRNCVNVSRLGDDKIKVVVAEPLENTSASELESFFKTIAGGRLELRNNKSATVVKDEEHPDLIVIDGWTEVKSISVSTYRGQFGITVEFTKSGKEKFTSMAGQTCYMFINGEAFPSSKYNSVDIKSEQTSFTFWLQDSMETADYYYEAFSCGLIPLNMDADTIEITYVNANTTANTICFVSVLVILVALSVLIIVKFRVTGVMFTIATLLGDYLLLFLLQAMPWVIMGLGGVITLGLVQVVQFSLIIAQLNQIKSEYMLGKSIVTSIDDAFSKIKFVVLDVTAIMLIGGIFFAVFGKGELTSIGTIMSISAIIIAVVNILVAKLLVNLSFAFGENNAKMYALPQREEAVNE